MWRHQLHLDGYRSVVFDQRGFGKTVWAPGAYIDWEDAVAVLDHLEIDSAVVVGCSLGGSVALHLALAVPDRVDGLVLVGAAARGWEPDSRWADDPMWDEAEAVAAEGDIDRIVEIDAMIWLAGAGRSIDQIDPALVELFADMDATPARTELERGEHVRSFGEYLERLDALTTPTLVVVGEQDVSDLIESAEFLAAKLSDRPAVVIPDAAHHPSLEQPGHFNQALEGFLGSI
jgi:pimeloyl-ACP methyl ester carboxylesterase